MTVRDQDDPAKVRSWAWTGLAATAGRAVEDQQIFGGRRDLVLEIERPEGTGARGPTIEVQRTSAALHESWMVSGVGTKPWGQR